VAELERESVDEMGLFVRVKGIVEELGLVVVFIELPSASTFLDSLDLLRVVMITTLS
jgi:hypothetical protein